MAKVEVVSAWHPVSLVLESKEELLAVVSGLQAIVKAFDEGYGVIVIQQNPHYVAAKELFLLLEPLI